GYIQTRICRTPLFSFFVFRRFLSGSKWRQGLLFGRCPAFFGTLGSDSQESRPRISLLAGDSPGKRTPGRTNGRTVGERSPNSESRNLRSRDHFRFTQRRGGFVQRPDLCRKT